jgi:tRNA(adenine34) deaminase
MDDTTVRTFDESMMRRCFELAMKSAQQGEYPYGAVIVHQGKIVAESTNRVAHERDVTRHAEVVAISKAQKAIGSTTLDDCTIYANVEPCAFCSYAIRETRIGKVVYATSSPIMGGMSRWNILADPKLSETMPEVFAPPPHIVHDFLSEEADATLRRSAPVTWAFVRKGGLLDVRLRRVTDAEHPHLGKARPPGWLSPAKERLMRFLRNKFFDRFGRGGAA